ncbi:MAG: hypothetical protein AB4080_03195 [Trichodesmium sp.]
MKKKVMSGVAVLLLMLGLLVANVGYSIPALAGNWDNYGKNKMEELLENNDIKYEDFFVYEDDQSLNFYLNKEKIKLALAFEDFDEIEVEKKYKIVRDIFGEICGEWGGLIKNEIDEEICCFSNNCNV